MEPGSHPCTNPFPFYELHHVAHNTMDTTTPSAMDILCEIVNSEYSDISYTMAPPVVSIPSHVSANHQHMEKESFLDILYSTGSKAMEIVDNDVEMIHPEQHAPYSIQFDPAPATSNTTAAHVFSPPDMHHFKLPLLEQEPEASITSSQADESFKRKEIRRNLERSLLMQEAVGASCTACPINEQYNLGTILSREGEGKHAAAEKHEMSACSNPMMLCEGYEYMDSPMVDKVSSSSARPSGDENKRKVKEYPNAKPSKRKASSCARLAEGGSSLKKSATAISNTTSNIARTKHIGVAGSAGANAINKPTSKLHAGDDDYTSCKGTSVQQDAGEEARVMHMELGSIHNVGRGNSLLVKSGQRKPLVEKSLEKNWQLKGTSSSGRAAAAGVEGQVAAGIMRIIDGAAAVPARAAHAADQEEAAAAAAAGGLQAACRNMTHISVERNRRKQMNEHLAILRSLMPNSYVQRSDQASVIGGVVEFIKELQQLLASLETQKRRRAYVAEALSPRVSIGSGGPSPRANNIVSQLSPRSAAQELVATSRSPLADVEVKLAGGAHVLLRTLSHKATRGQLLHLIAALECMSLEILHLNITTLQQAILYTFTLKIGIECRLSVDELADVGQQIFKDIHARRL